jgi:hypothetical protein
MTTVDFWAWYLGGDMVVADDMVVSDIPPALLSRSA